jgi:hypothetical protein
MMLMTLAFLAVITLWPALSLLKYTELGGRERERERERGREREREREGEREKERGREKKKERERESLFFFFFFLPLDHLVLPRASTKLDS